jgi:ketose-bisphosphate aldolase
MIPEDPARLIREAADAHRAIPAFNVNNLETVQGVVAGAERAASPVFLQISPGAIAYAGYEAITQLAFSAARAATVPVLVHLDHCRDSELVRRALRDGFPSVMFDGSPLAEDANISITAALVEEAAGTGAIVEAELGIIGGIESMTLDEARASVTKPHEAAAFVAATDVHILAPALGNLHRMPDDSVHIDLQHLAAVSAAASRPLALHGGSGIDRGVLADVIANGVVKVNISSRVGRALAAGIQAVWRDEPQQTDARRFMAGGRQAIVELTVQYAVICGSADSAAAEVTAKTWDDGVDEPE